MKRIINELHLKNVVKMLNLSIDDAYIQLHLHFLERLEKYDKIPELKKMYDEVKFIAEYRELVIEKWVELSNTTNEIIDLFQTVTFLLNLTPDSLNKIEKIYPTYKEDTYYLIHNSEMLQGYIDIDFQTLEKEEKVLRWRIDHIETLKSMRDIYEEIKVSHKYYFQNEILICFPNIQRMIFEKMIEFSNTFDEIRYFWVYLHNSGVISFFKKEYKDSWEKLNAVAINKANEIEDFAEVFRMHEDLPNFGDAYFYLAKRCIDLAKTPNEALLVNFHIGENGHPYEYYAKKKTTPIFLKWIEETQKDLNGLKVIHEKLKDHSCDSGIVMEKLLNSIMEV